MNFMRGYNAYFLPSMAIVILGCSTIPPQKEIKEIKKTQTRRDMQTAVEAVKNTISGKNMKVKYCPVCGRHFNGNVESCPNDGTKLKEAEE